MLALRSALVALFCVFSASGSAPIGGYPLKYILQRPFIGGLIVGIIFGDIQRGIIVGCAMQLVYIGMFAVGGVGAMDLGIVSFPCVAVAVASHIDISAAIAITTALATVYQSLDYLVRAVSVPFGEVMKSAVRQQNWHKFSWGYVGLPTILYIFERGVTSFILVYFGSGPIKAFLNWLPQNIMNSFSALGMVLPAIGMAALMVFLVNDGWGIIFFILGFAMNQYLKLTPMGMLFPAIVIAYLYYRTINNSSKPASGNDNDVSESDDRIYGEEDIL